MHWGVRLQGRSKTGVQRAGGTLLFLEERV